MKSLIKANRRVNWKRISWSFGIFTALLPVTQLIDVVFISYSRATSQVDSFRTLARLIDFLLLKTEVSLP